MIGPSAWKGVTIRGNAVRALKIKGRQSTKNSNLKIAWYVKRNQCNVPENRYISTRHFLLSLLGSSKGLACGTFRETVVTRRLFIPKFHCPSIKGGIVVGRNETNACAAARSL